MIGKICKENGIIQEELLSFFVSNSLISWMRSNRKRFIADGIWKPNIRLPRLITLDKIKKNRGKKKFQIPNLFKIQQEQKEYRKYLDEYITYDCPNCKAKIERHPTNRSPCPLCKAPYQYDGKAVMEWFME